MAEEYWVQKAMKVHCPTCKADPGEPCAMKRKKTAHSTRLDRYLYLAEDR
jgi:hypothetical protein